MLGATKMHYDEYKATVWATERPLYDLASSLCEDENSKKYIEPDRECLCKIDWLNYCIKHNEISSFSKIDLFTIFDELICLFDKHVESDLSRFDFGLFYDFMRISKDTYLNRRERQELDDRLIDSMRKILRFEQNSRYDVFMMKLCNLFIWSNFRYRYLHESGLGVSASEFDMASGFFNIQRKSFMEMRAIDFEKMASFGNYVLWLYRSCRTIDRRMIAGEIVKMHDFTLEILRHTLASCRANAYDDREESILRAISELNSETSLSPTVFISYCWSDDKVADEIQSAIGEYAVIRRDKNDLKSGDSISKFMETIREQDFAILVISDQYLKSRNCMYEVLQLFKDVERAFFINKIIFTVQESARIYNIHERVNYTAYWNNEYNRIFESIKDLPRETCTNADRELRLIRNISEGIGDLLEMIKDINNPTGQEFLDYVKQRIPETMKIGRNVVEDVLMTLDESSSKED